MTDEPYRWLEAMGNRREYIRDQLKGATPVFAFSRPEGILLMGVGIGQSKVFEIYDRHALAALGHPVDIEKLRQSLIEAAHLEGFSRAPEDVTLRRLINFSLGPLLKNSFEQIFSAPIIAEAILAEIGLSPVQDILARASFDGTHRYSTSGVAVAHLIRADEVVAEAWLQAQLKPDWSLRRVVDVALAAWHGLSSEKPFVPPAELTGIIPEGRTLELGLLDRRGAGRSRYRAIDYVSLS